MQPAAEDFIMHNSPTDSISIANIREEKRLQKEINSNHEGSGCWTLSNMLLQMQQMTQEFLSYLILEAEGVLCICIYLLLLIYTYVCMC